MVGRSDETRVGPTAPYEILSVNAADPREKMTRSRAGIGRIAAVVVVAVMVVIMVGVGGFFAAQGPPVTSSPQAAGSTSQGPAPTNQSSLASSTESTCTAGSSAPPCGCTLVSSNVNGTLYLSPHPQVGDDVCLQASLNDSAMVTLTVTSSAGSTMFSGKCAATPPPGAPQPTGDTCTSFWDTAKPDPKGNPVEPGTYTLAATGSSGTVQLEASFTLS